MSSTNIFIVDNNKQELIKQFNKGIYNNKFYTLSEFKDEYYYKYDEKALLYIMENYNVNYQVAKIYLNNLYYINRNNYNSNKLNKLYEIKEDLIKNNILTFNKLFKNYITDKTITFYGDFTSYDYQKVMSDLESKIVVKNEVYDQNNIHKIYKFNDLEDEVIFIANQIVKLIKEGVDINKIFITNIDSEYRSVIKRIFPMFNIPINLKEQNSIYGTKTAKEFIKELNISDITSTKSVVYEKLINIVNKYIWCDSLYRVKDLIIDDIKNTYIDNIIYDNAVNEIDFKSSNIKDDEYLFMGNFTQGVIPVIHKDEEFINDIEFSELGLLTSTELNILEKNIVINKIKNIKNLYISFKEKSLSGSYYMSSINLDLNYEVVNYDEEDYSNSHLYNKIHLTKLLDEFIKYGTEDKYLDLLNNSYTNLPYQTYDNKFKGIDKDKLSEYLSKGLTLSYTSMDNYYRCGFRYYLNYILKLNIFEDTFMIKIGNIFHEVLEHSFIYDYDFIELWNNACGDINNYSIKEQFFLKKLKNELKFIIEVINDQNNLSMLKKELHEEQVVINYDGSVKITFKGFIDKVKYLESNGETIVAIIDYKTGNPNLNLNNTIYGIEMQLPVYLFLAKNSSKLQNVKIAGFYLQKILNNEIVNDNKHTYEELKKKNLLLQGYSNSDINILSKFDTTYEDSRIVKSLKMSKNGFYHYSKMIDDVTMNKLTDIVEDKINNAIDDIRNAKFNINPKQIGKNNLGCEFCSFRDICYHTENDVEKLKEYKDLEFLGDDDNAKMD